MDKRTSSEVALWRGPLDRLKGQAGFAVIVKQDYRDVTEVSLDRELRRLVVITEGRRVVIDGVDRLYVGSLPWSEAEGTVHLNHGRLSVNGNIAAAES